MAEKMIEILLILNLKSLMFKFMLYCVAYREFAAKAVRLKLRGMFEATMRY